MSNHEDDARFTLFGARPKSRPVSEPTSSDIVSAVAAAAYQNAEVRPANKTLWDGDNFDDPADIAFDRQWQAVLVQLLCRVEFGRTSLEDPGHLRNPAGAVKIASAMINEVADFIATNVDQKQNARPIADVLAAAGRFLAAAQVAGQSTPKRGFFGMFGGNSGEQSAGRLEECMWVLRDLPLVLERYFGLLGGCFRSQKSTIEWVETSGVFISELKRALYWVEGFTN
jgi:hypothetical protein